MSGMHSFDDPAGLDRAVSALRRLPPVAPDATDRVVAAALAAQRHTRARRTWMARAAGLAIAAGLGGAGIWYGRRSAETPDRHTTVAERPAAAAAPSGSSVAAPMLAPAVDPGAGRVQLAATGAGEEAPVAVPFALRRPGARRVALVGDFDEWSPTAEPMRRGPGGTWTTTVALTPGRHAYAFVVDDTLWVTDPRAEVVRDPDYGRDHSVIVVGQP